MSYLFQDFTVGNVLTAAQLDQIEENILKHEHGVTANCQVLSLYATLSENETIAGIWSFSNILRLSSVINTFIDSADDDNYCNIFRTGASAGDFGSEAGHLVIQARVTNSVYRDIIFAGGVTTANEIMRITGEGNVGIGINPSFPFEVSKSNNGDYVATFKNTGTTGWGIRIQANSDTNPSLRIVAADGATTKINLYGNGNADFLGAAGIGVVAGSYPLTIKSSSDHLSWQNSSGTEVGRLGVQDSGAAGWIALYSSGVIKAVVHGNGQFDSAIATGTAPLIVISTTVCANLNADMVDGYHAGNTSGAVPISNTTVCTDLNADTLDGYDSWELRSIFATYQFVISTNAVNYVSAWDTIESTTEDDRNIIIPNSRNARRLYVRSITNTMNGSTVITVRKNNADTALTLTFSASETGTKSDTSTQIAFSAGDLFCVEIDTSASTTGSLKMQFSLLM